MINDAAIRNTKDRQIISKDMLFEMYVNKQMTDEQIAKEFGYNKTTIYYYRKKYGIDTIDRNLELHQKITKELLIDMYVNKQMTDQQIAKEFNCDRKTICNYRAKYGIATRNIDQILTKDFLIDLYVKREMVDEEIAKQVGCATTTVSQCRKKYGIENRRQNLDLYKKITKELLVDMYINKRMTDEEIAKELCCDETTIGKYRKKYGITGVIRETELQKQLTKEMLFDMYINKRMTDEEIAKQVGCTQTTISQYRKKYDIESIRTHLGLYKKITKEVLVDMYINKHMTEKQIAKEVGCAQPTINKYRNRYGIETTPRSISTSAQQQDVYNEICKLFININKNVPEIRMNDRKPISPLEIDIYIPEYHFGIEFNGGYWHNDIKHNKLYHYNKSKAAEKKAVFIYHIFSYEWVDTNKRKKILNQIKNLLGLNENKIYARKCKIREVDTKEKATFLNANHIQGNDHATIKLGLYYDGELVSLMTFTKPRFNKKYTWELSRFCSKANYNIIGGASKLFNHFIKNYLNSDETIISYSDIAKTKGNLYENLGFTLLHISDPNYIWWHSDNDYKTRYQCQMKNEVSLMEACEYYRVYDCGNKVWVYKK